jgi:hypothetical protein
MKILRTALAAAIVLSVASWPVLTGNGRLPGLAEATAYAATISTAVHGPAASNENERRGQEENRNGNNGNGNDNDENDNNDNNSNNNGNGNDNSSDGGGNSAPSSVTSSSSSAPPPPPPPSCSTPGQEMLFTSPDGRVTVRVFAAMAQSVRISFAMPVDPATVPPAPGPVIGGLLFQLSAQTCDGAPIPVLPSEANLGVHYSDADAAGRNESNFTLARLDTGANQWRNAQKQANDPPANFVSATITEMGYYVLYQRS